MEEKEISQINQQVDSAQPVSKPDAEIPGQSMKNSAADIEVMPLGRSRHITRQDLTTGVEFELVQFEGSADGSDDKEELKDSEEATDEVIRKKVEKRADLLAVAFQSVICVRQPHAIRGDCFHGVSTSKNAKSIYKNDPFRKISSYNSLLQAELAAGAGQSCKQSKAASEKMAHVQEIRRRLIERGTSQSSHSGSHGLRGTHPLKKLAMPVIHESLYVYAADKANGGIALAEKWRLTLVQPTGLSSHSKKSGGQRTSIITGLEPETNPVPIANPFAEENSGRPSDAKQTEEVRELVEESLPSVVIMEDDYFQTDAQEKVEAQIQTLTSRLEKAAKLLPMNNLISSESVQAELRWEKTKNWHPNASKKESETIEMFIDDVGKIIVSCDYISCSEIKSHILQDQRKQAQIVEAGLRKDSMNQVLGEKRGGIFNMSGLQALSGAFTSSPTDKAPMGRQRVVSDVTPQIQTFGQRLSTRLNAQLTTSGDSKDLAPSVTKDQAMTQNKLQQNLFSALGPSNDSKKDVAVNSSSAEHKLSGESQSSHTGSFFQKIGSIVNSARGYISSRRTSINVADSQATTQADPQVSQDRPTFKQRTMSGNPFLAENLAANQTGQTQDQPTNYALKSHRNRQMSNLMGLSSENMPAGRPRVSSLRQDHLDAQTSQSLFARQKEYRQQEAALAASLDPEQQTRPNFNDTDASKFYEKSKTQVANTSKETARDLMHHLSISRSISKKSNLQLMDEDGTVIEINSQGSQGTSTEMSPQKLNKIDDSVKSGTKDEENNFGFLDFDANQLANSIGSIGRDDTELSSQLRAQLRAQPLAPLSTRSETEEEKTQRFYIHLHTTKIRAEMQLKAQMAELKAQQQASFVQISQEGHRDKMVCRIKSEFVNVLKVRKLVTKSLL